MPNWTTNEIRFSGNSDTVQKIMSEIKECIAKNEGIMNHFIPRPDTYDEYDTTNYQSRTMNEGDMSYAGRCTPYNNNEPHVLTQEFIDKWKAAEEEQMQKYGAVGWYDWDCKYWGCKWDMSDCYCEDDYLECSTPWNEPDAFIRGLSKLYPDIEITMESSFEDSDFLGLVAHNGELKDIDVSKEFIENHSWGDEEADI